MHIRFLLKHDQTDEIDREGRSKSTRDDYKYFTSYRNLNPSHQYTLEKKNLTPKKEADCRSPPHRSHHRPPKKVKNFIPAQNLIPSTPVAKSEQERRWVSRKLWAVPSRAAVAKTLKFLQWTPYRFSFQVFFDHCVHRHFLCMVAEERTSAKPSHSEVSCW